MICAVHLRRAAFAGAVLCFAAFAPTALPATAAVDPAAPPAAGGMNLPSLQHWLEHFGIAVAAITGVLAARGKRIDLFGIALVLVLRLAAIRWRISLPVLKQRDRPPGGI